MAIFEAVKLTWKGRDYEIPPDQVMRCIAKVEDIVTLFELQTMVANSRRMSLSKLAMAFGAALRHAGAYVSDDEVYAGMFKRQADAINGSVAVRALLTMMVPPAAIEVDEAPAEGKAEAGAKAS